MIDALGEKVYQPLGFDISITRKQTSTLVTLLRGTGLFLRVILSHCRQYNPTSSSYSLTSSKSECPAIRPLSGLNSQESDNIRHILRTPKPFERAHARKSLLQFTIRHGIAFTI